MTAAEGKANNVVAAIAAVKGSIGGVEKLTANQRRERGLSTGGDSERGVSYAYRSIEQIAQKVQPLFAAYGVVCCPNVIEERTKDITVNQKPWTDTYLLVRWDVYGPGGRDDVIVCTTAGLGRDNSDKGVNKAMTGAYKNLLLRLLDIGDPDDDTDHVSNEAEYRREPAPDPADVLFERVRRASETAKEHMKGMRELSGKPLTARGFHEDEDWMVEVRDYLDSLEEGS